MIGFMCVAIFMAFAIGILVGQSLEQRVATRRAIRQLGRAKVVHIQDARDKVFARHRRFLAGER